MRERFPDEAVAFRGQAGHQRNLVLVLMTDGDNQGVNARKASFDAKLVGVGQAARGAAERILCLIPTWSIETWLRWLSDPALSANAITEGASYKDDAAYTKAVHEGLVSPKIAVSNWAPPRADEPACVPSLSDARTELTRIP